MASNVLAAEGDQQFCAAVAGGVARPRITWPLSSATRWKRSTCQGCTAVIAPMGGRLGARARDDNDVAAVRRAAWVRIPRARPVWRFSCWLPTPPIPSPG
jgi:hypothetical protein